jgi:flagellar biosynthesis protein FlhA
MQIDAAKLKSGWPELILPVGIITCLFVIFVPLPPAVMDVLLAANISIAVIILLTTLYVRAPIELSVFPSILLATTLARLSLNIATTRLILTGGATDLENAAGQVIRSFGEFVAGDHIAIGMAIFLIIVIIQFVVITKGATRISEVTARFALDGMPGRQLSIDADLNAGVIDNETAQQKREDLAANADFYGAMDGASKFVRGDAIAGILITLVNIVGGLIVGITSNMSLVDAASVFTKLTIGDGLVSQLPALLISVAAAMLVTRSTRESNLPRESFHQLFSKPAVLIMTSGLLIAMVFTQLPKLPLLILAAVFLLGARWINRQGLQKKATKEPVAGGNSDSPQDVTIERLLGNETLEMELGLDLIPLADPKYGGTLLPAVTRIRKQLASSLGVILPRIRIRDNLQLPAKEYRILVQGNPVEIGTIFPDYELAVDGGRASGPIEGAVATETTDDGQAFWIDPANRSGAEQLGYKVRSATAVLSSRMTEVADKYAADLLTRDATNQLIEETRKSTPAVVDELLPDLLSLKQLQKILKQLVAEQVSIRPLGLILETIGDVFAQGHNETWQLVESVRQRLAPQITAKHLGNLHSIKAVTIGEKLQTQIAETCSIKNDLLQTSLSQKTLTALADSISTGADNLKANGQKPIFCVGQEIRPVIALIAREQRSDAVVLGSKEIVGTYVESIGEISTDQIDSGSVAA